MIERPQPQAGRADWFAPAAGVDEFIRAAFLEPSSPLYIEQHEILGMARIGYLWAWPEARDKNRTIIGTAQLVTPAQRKWTSLRSRWQLVQWFGAEPDFVITLAAEWCLEASDAEFLALLDHELCFPAGTTVAGPGVEASMTRWYAGQMVEIRTAAGYLLSGTPNHPILTHRGWVPLGLLNKGDYVVSCTDPERVAASIYPHEHQVPAFLEQVASAALVRLGGVPASSQNLDADVTHADVDIVAPDCDLLPNLVAETPQQATHLLFGRRGGVGSLFASRGHAAECRLAMPLTTPSRVRQLKRAGALLDVRPVALPLAAIPDRYSVLPQHALHHEAADPQLLLDRIRRHSAGVFLDHVRLVHRFPYEGHVYNLQTKGGWYIANNIVTHNCHCTQATDEFGLPRFHQDGRPMWGARAHDVEQFVGVVERWGADAAGVRELVEAAARPARFGTVDIQRVVAGCGTCARAA